MQGRAYHDLGGSGRFVFPIPRETSPPPRWAVLVEALRNTLGSEYCLHEQRRKVEEMGADVYERAGYYELRALAMKETLVEKGLLSAGQIEKRMKRIGERQVKDD